MSKYLANFLFITMVAASACSDENEEEEHQQLCAACSDGEKKDACLSKLSSCETTTEEGTEAHEQCEEAANDGC